MSDVKVSMPVSAVEMQEYLFSETLAKVAAKCESEKHNVTDWSDLKRNISVSRSVSSGLL